MWSKKHNFLRKTVELILLSITLTAKFFPLYFLILIINFVLAFQQHENTNGQRANVPMSNKLESTHCGIRIVSFTASKPCHEKLTKKICYHRIACSINYECSWLKVIFSIKNAKQRQCVTRETTAAGQGLRITMTARGDQLLIKLLCKWARVRVCSVSEKSREQNYLCCTPQRPNWISMDAIMTAAWCGCRP